MRNKYPFTKEQLQALWDLLPQGAMIELVKHYPKNGFNGGEKEISEESKRAYIHKLFKRVISVHADNYPIVQAAMTIVKNQKSAVSAAVSEMDSILNNKAS